LNVSPEYRRPLSTKQVSLLGLIYKFRFVSVGLLAEEVGKDRSSVYENLYVLTKQDYITKRYDKTYRLRGRPASYCLSAKGIRYLWENTRANQKALRNMYKNKHMSEEHIDHCLLTMTTCNTLRKQTNDAFDIGTRYELTDDELFLRPLPDLYLSRKKPKDDQQLAYTLDILEPNLPFWVFQKRLRDYQDHCEESELEDGEIYPYVLLVAPSARTEERLVGIIENMLNDFEVYTTTRDRLLNPENAHKSVWKDAFGEEDEAGLLLRDL
jgi:predicted transcriptional regulator